MVNYLNKGLIVR